MIRHAARFGGIALPVILAAGLSGCGDFLQDPAPAGPARIAVVLAQTTGGAAAAFDAADNLAVDVRVAGRTVVAESVPVSSGGASLEIPVSVPLPDGAAAARVAVALRRGGDDLFQGATDVDLAPWRTARVTLALAPVVAEIVAVPPPLFTVYGQAADLEAEAVFATGDVVPGETPAWSSLDPGIVTVEPTANGWRAVAVADGLASLRATGSGRSTTVSARVEAVVVSVEVLPGDATLLPGETLSLSAVLRDGGGAPIPGRTVQWSSDDPGTAVVGDDGVVTAVAPGVTDVRATRDGVSASSVITVRPPGPGVTTLTPVGITADGATLRARVDPAGSDTRVVFRYGTDPALTQAVTTAPTTVPGSAPPTEVTRAVQGLPANTTLYVQASATNAAGTARGDVVAFTTLAAPAAPSGLTARLVNGVELSWQDNSSDETRFEIERDYVGPGATSGADGPPPARVFQPVGSVGAGVTTFVDPAPPTGELRYRVRACSATACSAWSPALPWFYGLPPRVQTRPAVWVGNDPDLSAFINPLDAPTTVRWEIAEDPSFTTPPPILLPTTPVDAGSGHFDVIRTFRWTSYQYTVYYIRAVATNRWGTTVGNVVILDTSGVG